MTYNKTVWTNNAAPAVDASHLNKIEQGIADALTKDVTDTLYDPISNEGKVIFVNGQEGPVVEIALSDLPDVDLPVLTKDAAGNTISPGPNDDSTLVFDASVQKWKQAPAADMSSLDQRFAPAGYLPPWYVPSIVLERGQTLPADFPINGIIVDKDAVLGSGEPAPGDFGFASWTADPATLSSTVLLPQNVLNASLIPIRGDYLVTHAAVYVTTAGTGTTQSHIALYDQTGTRIKRETSIVDENGTTTDFNSVGLKLGTFAVPYQAVADQSLYIAAWSVGGTAAPTVLRGNSIAGAANIRYPGTTIPRFGVGAAATTSTAPAALGTLTNGSAIWAAVVAS